MIIGYYLAPDDTLTIERVVAVLRDIPKGIALVVAGDINTDLEDSENDWRGTAIATAMTAAGGGRHDGTLSTEEAQMGKGETDVEHSARGQGCQVTDRLSSRDRQKSL